MEEGIQIKPCKFSRVGNGKIGQYPDDDEDGERERSNLAAANNRLHNWHHSSRIIRVSRASGGKDRHSKVWTSKGLRDRRVRLSVTTAIQFYDLQDRLGFDQPSKAIEWLIKAAGDAINELPELNGSFVENPKQFGDEKRIGDNVEQGLENQSQHFSGCSSTSDTSKGSGLSLSRSDARVNRVKARERARERAAKEKEKNCSLNHQNANPNPQNSSFTELLTSGINSSNNNNNNNNNNGEANLFHNKGRQWPWISPMDCFSSGQIQLGNSISQPMAMSIINNPFSFSGENQQQQVQLQHFPCFSDHLIPVGATGSQQQGPNGDYNLNFTISSGLAGFNRETLQSNSSQPNSLLPNLQRFSLSSAIEASSNTAFFLGENHHHQFPPGLQLYGDGSSRHSDHKGKGKN